MRLDFEAEGRLRHRVWSIEGTERTLTLTLDVHHEKLEPKKDLTARSGSPVLRSLAADS